MSSSRLGLVPGQRPGRLGFRDAPGHGERATIGHSGRQPSLGSGEDFRTPEQSQPAGKMMMDLFYPLAGLPLGRIVTHSIDLFRLFFGQRVDIQRAIQLVTKEGQGGTFWQGPG